MVVSKVRITNEIGLHARPAALFVQTANKFTADIGVANLTTGGQSVNGKSILSVLMLGAMQNHELQIRADGADADVAVRALRELVLSGFAETAE